MVTLLFYICFWFEAKMDTAIIAGQRHDASRSNRQWHAYNFWMLGFLAMGVSLFCCSFFPLFAMSTIRLWVLQVHLNVMRGFDIRHLGQNPIDQFFDRFLGRNLTYMVKFCLVAFTFLLELYRYEKSIITNIVYLLPFCGK